MDKIRSFLAINFESFYQRELENVLRVLRREPIDAKWINPQQAHLTLCFFGSIGEDLIQSIVKNLDTLLAPQKPLEVYLKGLGAFPNMDRARVIWIGIEGATDGLKVLKKDVDRSLEKIGIPAEDRSFRPHLTLGRLRKSPKGLAPLLEKFTDFSSLNKFMINRLVLFRSDLTPKGPLYKPLHTFQFKC